MRRPRHRAAAGAQRNQVDHRHRHQPAVDAEIEAEQVLVQIEDSDGRRVGVLGLAHDITELHEAQIALKERIKEQDCLYGITRASENLDRPLAELLQELGLAPQLIVGHSAGAAIALRIGRLPSSRTWASWASSGWG